MTSSVYRRLLAVVFVLSFAAVASAQPLQWFWWKSEPSLALTPDQSTQIDAIFQDGIARLMQQKDELDRLSEERGKVPVVAPAFELVEAVRSTLNKTRTLMLLHMRQVLKPEQRLKLNALRDRRVKEQQLLRDKDKAGASPDAGKRTDSARKPSH